VSGESYEMEFPENANIRAFRRVVCPFGGVCGDG